MFFKEITQSSEKEDYPYIIQREILSAISAHNKAFLRMSLLKFEEHVKKSPQKDRKNYFLRLIFEIYEQTKTNDDFKDITIAPNAIKGIFECGNSKSAIEGILESVSFSEQSQSQSKSASGSDFANRVMKIIEENYSNPSFCIQFIIEEIGLTAPYFGKKFKAEFQKSFNAYLLEYRLNKAVGLIMNTEYTNGKIASLCGFNSESYFVNIFRKNMGVSPKKYKSEHIN